MTPQLAERVGEWMTRPPARIDRLVIGAMDEKAGAVGSRYNVLSDPRLLHEVRITYDVLAEEARSLLRSFFETRRT